MRCALIGCLALSLTSALSAEDLTDPAEFPRVGQSSEIEDIFVVPHIARGEIEVRLWPAQAFAPQLARATVDLTITHPDGTETRTPGVEVRAPAESGPFTFVARIDPVRPWHPDSPNLCHLGMVFRDPGGSALATLRERFGMREIEARDARFFVNGQPFYLRAAGGEGGCGCDDLSREEIERRLRALRRYGFNGTRHHSHVPTDTYLDVADELGVFVQMEIHGQLGADPSAEQFQRAREDWMAMIRRGRRHPSTFIYSVGNEIYRNDPGLVACQDRLWQIAREMDPTALFLNRSGSNPFNDAVGHFDLIERPIGEYEHVGPFAREDFDLYLRGDRRGRSDEFPIIAHEYPLVASYPNPELAALYPETPPWIAVTQENLRANGQEALWPLYVRNCERIQAICRREMIEEARKWPELDGYSMLRFVDCGAYVSGVVNDFAEPKNVTAEEFLRSNGETVLLCTWNQRSFEFGEELQASLEISHHGTEISTAPECRWWLMEGPRVLAEGVFDDVRVQPVNVAPVGTVRVEIPALDHPAKLTLRAELTGTRPLINNEWHFWAFPGETVSEEIQRAVTLWDPRGRMAVYQEVCPAIQRADDPAWTPTGDETLILTDSWQEGFCDLLDHGGNIWVLSDKSWPWPEEIGIFGLHITHFVPSQQAPVVFPEFDELCNKWLTICSNTESRYGNSGTVIAPHPALGDFPHEGFCDLHMWPLVYRAKVLQLDRFPPGTEPIIRAIDNFHRGQNKAYMVDLAVGDGHVLVSTLNFTEFLARDAATRHLFGQVLRYATGSERRPSAHMTSAEMRQMIEDFAQEYANREPLTHDEMPARYTTRWRDLLSPGELIPLPITEADGADESRLGVHWEYAQTQWFLNARPGDALTWTFENESGGDFTGTLNVATPIEGVEITIGLDEDTPRAIPISASGAWEQFAPTEFQLPGLRPGEHRLTVTVPHDTPEVDGRSVQIRDLELRANGTD